MTRTDYVLRARSAACGDPITYRLGKGGFWPDRDTPADKAGLCDCSGFVSWCLGVSRQTTNSFFVHLNGGWIETTAVVADALAVGGLFSRVSDPVPGDVIVWGDSRNPKTGAPRQGHIGIVTEVEYGSASRVIHCSSGNWKKNGQAVQETDAAIFRTNGAICARFGTLAQAHILPDTDRA